MSLEDAAIILVCVPFLAAVAFFVVDANIQFHRGHDRHDER
jgi:uncharacterized membrane protein YhaH (DUF805 family)